jgi:hypothetical protein
MPACMCGIYHHAASGGHDMTRVAASSLAPAAAAATVAAGCSRLLLLSSHHLLVLLPAAGCLMSCASTTCRTERAGSTPQTWTATDTAMTTSTSSQVCVCVPCKALPVAQLQLRCTVFAGWLCDEVKSSAPNGPPLCSAALEAPSPQGLNRRGLQTLTLAPLFMCVSLYAMLRCAVPCCARSRPL